ncbi:uncharacterized protein PITG_06443 [Phytophthora infestans T30-4]|uniref:Uncharacterized protein n=2 Tax=Phytophthora infestans TaxID=4787 RepID=D0N4V8_PHYIT|nr:uncharacterized protein PITG_06443 [Phytophthora infestans T30-4]EEY69916.1 hypothetical protein PITG_06443 [Phytophthora infestans T30-4]KAF4038667.1 hypothetical protein GN244_ATG09194 [Phytophthora infestans]KAF4134995.1 hypothetical protein GN958_ATG15811 [Phytophthora infestans]KAI9983563.1 hypothetical protein PInf_007628 [Phytophthora infestans]|eukprot:XP_002998563.1 hypothetical protein PITG_06443 [Phytophthora infestans T30-4]
MIDISLAHELARARLVEIPMIREKLERIMQVQLEFQALVNEHEERSYELLNIVIEEVLGTANTESLSFDMLLEILVKVLIS